MDQQLERARFGQTVRCARGERFLIVRTWNGVSVRAIATRSRERWCLGYDQHGNVIRATYADLERPELRQAA